MIARPSAAPETTQAPQWPAALSGLVSQLERAKFHRLLRHMLDEELGFHDLIDEPAEAIGTPGAELLIKHVAKPTALGYNTATWVFRPVHLPVNRWGADALAAQLDRAVEAAFADLARRIHLLDRFRPRTTFKNMGHLASWRPDEDQTLYTFTNVPHDINDGPLGMSVKRWITLWDRHLPGVARPEFGLGSPETLAANSPAETFAFLQKLLAEPSGYVAVAREGRISVAPFTEHGSYVAGCFQTREQAALATATATLRFGPSQDAVWELEDLLNRPRTGELDIQAFLAERPALLAGLNTSMVEATPHVCLFDGSGTKLVPDFLARLDEQPGWELLELKGPHDAVIVERGGRTRPSAKVAAALDQLLRYRDYFHDSENRQKLAPLLCAAPFQPLLTVVIGRGHPGRRLRWRGAPGLPEASIVTYDHLLETARRAVTERDEQHPAAPVPPNDPPGAGPDLIRPTIARA